MSRWPNIPLLITLLTAPLLINSCYSTRWAEFDTTMKSEIGVKNKDYYISKWGPPSRGAKLDEGGEVLTWEWQGVSQGDSQGWKKTLIFSPDGLLKDYNWKCWGMPLIAF